MATAGYEVVKARMVSRSKSADPDLKHALEEPELKFLTPRPYGSGSIPSKRVRPLDDSTLFDRFGTLKRAQDVVEFANQFGLLGGDYTKSIIFERTLPAGDALVVSIGELIESWLEEARAMHIVCELWMHVKKNRESKILSVLSREARIETSKEETPYRLPTLGSLDYFFPAAARVRAPRTPADVVEAIKNLKQGGDPVPLAMDCIVSTINWQLPPNVGAALTWTREGTRRPKAQMSLTSTSLHQAIWLQLAAAVRGWKTFDECGHCRSLYEVTIRKIGRPHSYCSDACKMKAYRKRQVEARRLRKRGMPVREISERLKVKEQSIERWTAPTGNG